MKILYINVIEQNAGWGAEYFINEEFKKAGHETITLDYRKYRNILGEKLLKAGDFDVLLLQRGDGFPLELLKAVNRPKFFWASELIARNRDQDVLLNSGEFSHIFVHSDNCKKLAKQYFNGVEEARLSTLINGFCPKVFSPIKDITKTIDILFVGNITERRRKIINELKSKFNIIESQSAYGMDMNLLLNKAKVVLNIHAEEFLDTETRVFETLGSGAFLISETLASENPFIAGKHYVEAEIGNVEAMIKKIEYYLAHEEERNKIALEGHEEAVKNHTYEKRAEYIANLMKAFVTKENLRIPAVNEYAVNEYIKNKKANGITVTYEQVNAIGDFFKNYQGFRNAYSCSKVTNIDENICEAVKQYLFQNRKLGLYYFEKDVPPQKYMRQYILEKFSQVRKESPILEIGPGNNPIFLKSEYKNWIGIDKNWDGRAIRFRDRVWGENKYDESSIFSGGWENISQVCSNNGIDYKFDLICSSHSYEHTFTPIQSLIEASKMLKSGGILVLFVPDGFSDDPNTKDPTHTIYAVPEMIEEFFKFARDYKHINIEPFRPDSDLVITAVKL